MLPTTKGLRPYQARLITDLCRADGHVLVEQPTGSGKTLAVVAFIGMQLGRRFTHAVIAAPQEQIEHGFVHRDYRSVSWPDHNGVCAPAIAVRDELICRARQSRLGSVRQLLAYLRQLGPLDHALACTHAALNQLTPEKLPDDLSGKALFIDEAHHASADGLSQIVTVWRKRGGQLLFFTATPYRGDGRPVAVDRMRLLRRSLAEHMADRDEAGRPFAPGLLESEIVAVGNAGDSITAGQFTGEEAPPASYYDGLVTAICRKWENDGKPKTIVRVPPMRGGSGGLVDRLIRALHARDARVRDASGTSQRAKNRFLDFLKKERERSYADSEFDVLVGIQRVFEGTDWPVCSAAYCVGMPGSLNTVVQLLGRAMRPKSEDYPAAHRDRARLVFFVPCSVLDLADLKLVHSRHALLTCCFLADHEVGQEWIVLREVRRGIEAALGTRDENPAAADAEHEANAALDPDVRAEVELVMASAREQIISEGGEPTLGKVVQLAAKTRPDLPEGALHRVAAEILASQPGSSGAKAQRAIHTEVAKRLRIDPMVKKAMEEAFAVVVNEFRAVTLRDSPVLESIGRQVHGVTGGQMREFAQRLRDAAPRPLTEEQILAWADEHFERTSKWPTIEAGEVTAAPGETWSGINAALGLGLRGLPGGSSLPKLLAERRGRRHNKNRPPITVEQILRWADAHQKRTGKWPTVSSGSIQEAPGETWMGVEMALQKGNRGLPKGSSLAKLLAEHRGMRNRGRLPQLTIDQILTWMDSHHARTGQWPTPKSGLVHDAPGESWRAINLALHYGRRGLPRGSSLAQLRRQHRGVKQSSDCPLRIEQILAWADEHRARTGRWPTAESGVVAAEPSENWGAINMALRIGARGLPGGSSLARLLAEHRGKKAWVTRG